MRTRNGRYAIRYIRDGKSRYCIIGSKRSDAVEALAAIESQRAREKYLGVKTIVPLTVAEVWEKIRPARASRLCPRAMETADQHIGRAVAFFGERPLCDITPADLSAFLASLAAGGGRKPGTGRKGATLNRARACLSIVWREAISNGFAAENAVLRVPRYKVEETEGLFLGEEDIRALIRRAPTRVGHVIAILADTGLRRGELLSLCWPDVDLLQGTVLVRRSKTGKGRQVPLTARARSALAALRARRVAIPMLGEDFVFADWLAPAPGVTKEQARRNAEALMSKRFSRLAAAMGLPGAHLHTLRHSCASRMVHAGVPLSAVAAVLGHSVLRTSALYGRHLAQDATRTAIRALESANGPSVPDPVPEGGEAVLLTSEGRFGGPTTAAKSAQDAPVSAPGKKTATA